jgi:hypothetical protein
LAASVDMCAGVACVITLVGTRWSKAHVLGASGSAMPAWKAGLSAFGLCDVVCAQLAPHSPPPYLHTSRATALRLRSHEVCRLLSAAGGAWAVAGPHVREPRSATLASCCGECQWTKGGCATWARILRCSRKCICVGRGCCCLLGCLCPAPHLVQCEHNLGALGVPIHVSALWHPTRTSLSLFFLLPGYVRVRKCQGMLTTMSCAQSGWADGLGCSTQLVMRTGVAYHQLDVHINHG